MAKYLVIKPFTVKFFNLSNGKNEEKTFLEGATIDAIIDPKDKKLKTTISGEAPIFNIMGQTWVEVPIDSISKTDSKDKGNKIVKPLLIVSGIVLLLYFINTKKNK